MGEVEVKIQPFRYEEYRCEKYVLFLVKHIPSEVKAT